MSDTHQSAVEALKALLWELPAEFSRHPDSREPREQFHVIKKSNVRKVHRALWELQEYFGVAEEE